MTYRIDKQSIIEESTKQSSKYDKAIPCNGIKKKLGFSCKEDKNGFYIYTHRARSKSYPSFDKIPLKDINFIDSTG